MNLFQRVSLIAIPAMMTLTATCAGAANLVANGSFDNLGQVWVDNTGLGSDDLQSANATDIPGWTNVAGFVNEFWASGANGYQLTASAGNGSQYWVDLTGEANNKPYGGIEQSIATVAGQTYVLRFDLGSSTIYNASGFGAAALTASATGATPLASHLFTQVPTATNQWNAETLAFTANSSSTTIEFLADSDYTSRYTGLDNVSVIAAPVPEPKSSAMWLIGMGLLIGVDRLRARRIGRESTPR